MIRADEHIPRATREPASSAETPRVPADVPIDEPLLPARVHRPADLVRFFLAAAGVGLVLLLASFAQNTASGLESDVAHGTTRAPDFLVAFAGFSSTFAVLIVPVAFAIERVIRHDGLRVAIGVLAAVLANGVSLAVDYWVSHGASGAIASALTRAVPSGTGLTDPIHGYLAPVIAYMTAVGLARRPRWRVALWAVLGLDALAVLVGGYTTPLSIALTVLIGVSVGYGTLYLMGAPNVRPTAQDLLAGLHHVGFAPVAIFRTKDDPDQPRQYLMESGDSKWDVTVLDREAQASGFFYRTWRRLWLRGFTDRRHSSSLRLTLEREALLSYAVSSAGVRTPRLVATSELGPDAVILVYEHVDGQPIGHWDDAQLTDEVLAGIWEQVRLLQIRRIAHRALSPNAVVLDAHGSAYLTHLGDGQVAASDVALRMDIAELLTTLALRVGPERAVASAASVLDAAAVGSALPLLQSVGLSRATRSALKKANAEIKDADEQAKVMEKAEAQEKPASRQQGVGDESAGQLAQTPDLLTQIRDQILRIRPHAPVEPARLARVRLRTLITVMGGGAAAYFLLSQFTTGKHNPLKDLPHANAVWVAVAVLASAASYIAATLGLIGFVPEKLNLFRTVMVQLAGSFVKLMAPSLVGGVAINARFLQRTGIPPGQAVSSVGASQLIGVGLHILQLMLFGYLTGTAQTPSLAPSRTVIAGLLTGAVLILIVAAISPTRRWLLTRAQRLFSGVVPRLLDVLQRPGKLAIGIGGQLLVSMTFVVCLDACLWAFGERPSFSAVAVVFLAGNALGSIFPTPGGLGAVEIALTTGLTTAASVPYATALSAVLLFRLLTFWLPVLPGWISFAWLQRRQAL